MSVENHILVSMVLNTLISMRGETQTIHRLAVVVCDMLTESMQPFEKQGIRC